MKCFAILVCVLAAAVTARAIDLQQISKVLDVTTSDLEGCLTDNHLNNDDIDKVENIFHDNFSPEEVEKYMKNFSCFIACGFEKANITMNGQVQLDEVFKVAERNKFALSPQATQKLKDCAETVKGQTDKCDAALTFSLCFLQHMRKY